LNLAEIGLVGALAIGSVADDGLESSFSQTLQIEGGYLRRN